MLLAQGSGVGGLVGDSMPVYLVGVIYALIETVKLLVQRRGGQHGGYLGRETVESLLQGQEDRRATREAITNLTTAIGHVAAAQSAEAVAAKWRFRLLAAKLGMAVGGAGAERAGAP